MGARDSGWQFHSLNTIGCRGLANSAPFYASSISPGEVATPDTLITPWLKIPRGKEPSYYTLLVSKYITSSLPWKKTVGFL